VIAHILVAGNRTESAQDAGSAPVIPQQRSDADSKKLEYYWLLGLAVGDGAGGAPMDSAKPCPTTA
jgi:hypothetical protein